VACASWGIGEAVWSYYELALGREVPFPGWADLGFLGLIPLAVLGVLWLPTAPQRRSASIRALLDGLIIAGSLLFVGWPTVLAPTLKDATGSLFYRAMSLAYPVSDLVIIAIVLYVLARARNRERFELTLILGGLVSIAVADYGFAYLNLHGLYATGSLIDPIWDLGFVFIGLAAFRRPRFSESRVDDRRVGALSVAAPYVPLALAGAVAASLQFARGGLEPFLFWNAAAIVVFVAARQLFALADNLSLNHDLEGRVTERTAELQQALTELAESHKLQEQFVRNASHEIRTPLSILLGAMHLLSADTGLSSQSSTTVQLAGRATKQLRRLVEDLLLASGLTDAVTCEREPFDVEHELREAVGAVAVDRPVQLDVTSPLRGVGDPDRFGHVVRHLLSNAVKYAPAGTAVTIEAYEAAGRIHCVVRDEGPGVPHEVREHIFRPFYQVDGSPTREHGGLGLGLFLARRITEAMGGELLLDETKRGASFRAVLDAAEAEALDDDVRLAS
jgi:signal transduction histidine kinase